MNNQLFLLFLITMILTTLFCALSTRLLLPQLRRKKLGQTILEIGPNWHKSKEGTPTMGGLAFLLTLPFALCVLALFPSVRTAFQGAPALWLTLFFAFCNGAIGIFDDAVKFTKKRNQGLTARKKFLLQLLVAALYLIALQHCGAFTTALSLPFTSQTIELGVFAYPLSLLFLTGMVNSVNLTDGIDGLASGVTMTVGGFFAVAAVLVWDASTLLLAALTIGICLGFLFFNAHPAQIFMGDTGSLFLGGLVVGMAFQFGSPLLLLPVGIVYLIETISVILQVGYYKLTRKRLFLMAPFHHHLEKKGISEEKIVIFAIFVTIISSIFSLFAV